MVTPVIRLPSKTKSRPVPEAVTAANDHAAKLARERNYVAAITEIKRAIAITPHSRELWYNLSNFFWNTRQYEQALAAVDRSLRIDSVYAQAMFSKALILEDMRRDAEAEQWFEWAIEITPDAMEMQWCRSLFRLSRGDYERGFAEYEIRIPFRKRDNGEAVFPKLPAPYWKGEPLRGKKVFAMVEQGIGDTIMFHRWLPWLQDQLGPEGTLYFCAKPEVQVMLWEFRDMVYWIPEGVAIPEADYSLPIGSLPHYAGATLQSLPADPGFIRKRAGVQMKIGPAVLPAPPGPDPFKVGIVWSGNPEQRNNEERCVPLDLLLGLAAHPNVWLYSLQLGPAQADIDRLGAGEGLVCDLSGQCSRGLAVTASAMLQLDLVVTCCTSMAHLAGALSVPAWVMLPYNPYWIWGIEGETTPWYPSLRLYRQPKVNDWVSVLERIQDDLFAQLDARPRAVG